MLAEKDSAAEVEEGDILEEEVAPDDQMEDPEEEIEEVEDELEEVEELEEIEEEEEEEGEEEEEEGGEEYGVEQIVEGLGNREEEVVKEVPEKIEQKRKQRDFEVFVGGLPIEATEDDLQKELKKIGEVVEIRLAKIRRTNKNKGFGFVRFATVDQAKKAASELKHIKVKGKLCGIIKSIDNETLHLANICPTWTKDKLVEKLKTFKLENLEYVHLIEDPRNKGQNRGYAFLDFSTHMDAVAACCKLQKRYIYFGTDVRAEVSFAKSVEPDEEMMAQVKTVFVDGLPASWDETQAREQFKKFGEIESIQLARNMVKAKREDFAFVSFTTRQAALDCIENVNKDGIGEGDQKVLAKVTLKKPLMKWGPPTHGVRRAPIFKRFGSNLRSHGSGHSSHSRVAKLGNRYSSRGLGGRRLGDRSRGLEGYSSRGVGVQAQLSSPAGKFRHFYGRQVARNVPAVSNIRSQDLYSESSSAGRYALQSYQSGGLYAEADVRDPRFERHETHEYPAFSAYRRFYSELDHDLSSSSLTSRVRRGLDLEIGAYPYQGVSAYDENSRVPPDGWLGYDRMEYPRREYGIRYLSGTGAHRSYH